MRKRRTSYRSAAEWPSWTDEVAAGVGPAASFEPTEEDAAWAITGLGGHDGDAEVPIEVLERAAGEVLAADQLERGLKGF